MPGSNFNDSRSITVTSIYQQKHHNILWTLGKASRSKWKVYYQYKILLTSRHKVNEFKFSKWKEIIDWWNFSIGLFERIYQWQTASWGKERPEEEMIIFINVLKERIKYFFNFVWFNKTKIHSTLIIKLRFFKKCLV